MVKKMTIAEIEWKLKRMTKMIHPPKGERMRRYKEGIRDALLMVTGDPWYTKERFPLPWEKKD